MSKFYVEVDDETAFSIFEKRNIYDFDSTDQRYNNLVDFNFGEKFLYGRVKRDFVPMYFSSDFLQLKSFAPTNVQGLPLSAINFVVDMFERLRTQFEKCSAIGTIRADDPFLSSLKVFKGYQNPIDLHNSFLQTYLDSLSSELNRTKYKNFNEFMNILEALLIDTTKIYPITFSGFVKSRFCPISVSGLVVEIADAEYFNDNRKIEEFINSPNWEFYLNACRSYGFMVDKLIPWRLVADIATTEWLEYSRVYNLLSTEQILTDAYSRTDLIFFNKLKFYILNLYNQNANNYSESYDCNGVQRTRYIQVPQVTIEQFDKQIPEERLLRLYLRVRMTEEDKHLLNGQKNKLIQDTIQLYKIKNLSYALGYFENIVNQPFDSTGSLSYINERQKKRREDQ